MLGANKSELVRATGEELFAQLSRTYHVLLDDRDTTAGVKFNDADLLGMPVQLVLGEKNLSVGNVEVKHRITGERSIVALTDLNALLQSLLGN